jgi:hypothetical protein
MDLRAAVERSSLPDATLDRLHDQAESVNIASMFSGGDSVPRRPQHGADSRGWPGS